MLILTRKVGQGFLIGPDVEITITEISGDKVRIGIEAPREVKVLRNELCETVKENQNAATSIGNSALRALAVGLKKSGISGAGGLQEDKKEAQPAKQAEPDDE